MATFDDLIRAFLELSRTSEAFDEGQHPRDDAGKWSETSGGGGSSKKTKGKSEKGKGKKEQPTKQAKSVLDAGADEEGGRFQIMPDGGVEWVPAGETGTGAGPETKSGGQKGETITTPNGKERKVDVVDHNGVRIVTPTDLDTQAQGMTADEIKTFVDQVPAEHRDVFKEIRIMDEPYRDEKGRSNDSAAATYYPDTGIIEIHKNSQFNKETLANTISQTVRHEGAHALTDKLGDNFVNDWKQAARKDGGSISDYANTNTHEDIAETIARYWSSDPTERKVIERFFPERYAILKQYGVKPGG